MKFKIFIFVAFVFLTACSAMEVMVDEPINNKRIGISYEFSAEPILCHNHIGFTIFNNYYKEYPLNSNLATTIKDGYIRGLTSTGNEAVILEEDPQLYDQMTYSSWDFSMKISDKGKNIITRLGKEHDLDYVLYRIYYPEHILAKGAEDESICYGFHLRTGKNNDIPLIPFVGAHLFDAKTGQVVGTIRILNNAIEVKEPEDHTNISNEEIAYYVEMHGKFAERGIVDFVNISRK